MKSFRLSALFAALVLLSPLAAAAQQSTGSAQQPGQLQSDIARQVRRYRVGVEGGVTIDPEMISVGAHATFGPFFNPNLNIRPGFEIGGGEITTMVAFNIDVLYTIPGASGQRRWTPYVGAGPNFAFSHRGFEGEEDGNRFDFGEFNADTGVNLIVGAQRPNGLFFEVKATPGGVANVRLIAGFNF